MVYKNREQGFFPREGDIDSLVNLQQSLDMILSNMNKVCSPWNQREKNRFIDNLEESLSFSSSPNLTERASKEYQIRLMNLKAYKSDYKNWVELAVSFDK